MYQVSCIMYKMKIIQKVALAVFKDKKMLQVRTRKQSVVFYTLGGKIEAGENDITCLKREVKEELGCEIDEESLNFLAEFNDVAHADEGMLHIMVYTGKLIGEANPSSEIVEIGWFDSNSDKKNLSLIAQRTIFPWLKKHGYIN